MATVLRHRLLSVCSRQQQRQLLLRAPPPLRVYPARGFASSQREDAADDERSLSFAQEFVKPRMDATFLVDNYTAPALAAAYQDREYTLRLCAELLNEGKLEELKSVLRPYQDFSLEPARTTTPIQQAFAPRHLERIRKRLSRLPRQLTKAYTQRASVVIPLCLFEGAPSVLFTVRSLTVGKHKGEVCFPGGMVDATDSSIEATCLREMKEEVGLAPEAVQVLGILRCDWSSVTSITGVAVTPVVGFIGEMSDRSLVVNEAEVDSLFTVSLADLSNPRHWIRRSNATPVFTGGPHVIWGLTAYVLDICLQEALLVGDDEPPRQ
ncbi:hypothetical protein PybrP1_013003 [[Pythium] brassicae (nom. inval.)]|nr:hypothetical protein PybrP1_013003 [[Pythium] brassicae (nom. inval.)]